MYLEYCKVYDLINDGIRQLGLFFVEKVKVDKLHVKDETGKVSC